jgi:hypothetical protein
VDERNLRLLPRSRSRHANNRFPLLHSLPGSPPWICHDPCTVGYPRTAGVSKSVSAGGAGLACEGSPQGRECPKRRSGGADAQGWRSCSRRLDLDDGNPAFWVFGGGRLRERERFLSRCEMSAAWLGLPAVAREPVSLHLRTMARSRTRQLGKTLADTLGIPVQSHCLNLRHWGSVPRLTASCLRV